MKRKAMGMLLAGVTALCLTAYGEEISPAAEETAAPDMGSTYTANAIEAATPSKLGEEKYANVPGTPTQNAVQTYMFSYFSGTEQEITHPVTVLQPDALIANTLTDIYDFVQEQNRMPVRYFPEEVQRAVQEILSNESIDAVDILHMTEFFGICPDFAPIEDESALGCMQLDADYEIGQLVVVMFGDVSGVDVQNLSPEEIAKIQWTPLAAEVTATGEVSFSVPAELLEQLAGRESLFLVLTDRIGGLGQGESAETPAPAQNFIPSKNAGDLSYEYGKVTSSSGAPLPDDFRIYIQPHSSQTRNEIERLQKFMCQDAENAQDDLPIAAYFSDELQAQMALLLEAVQPDELICYNASFIWAENYVDTYGDAIASFRFAVSYSDETELVCLLGTLKNPLPENQAEYPILPEESQYDWAVLRGEAKDGYVSITFPQQLLPIMEREGALALILSQPLTGENP